MERWVAATDFIEADVIRWKEGVFDRRPGAQKALRLGERSVIAEVLYCDDAWVRLLIRACTATEGFAGKSVPNLKIESDIKRAKKTILRGKPERLLWSDETARAEVMRAIGTPPSASKFLESPPARPRRKKGKALRSRSK